MMVRRSAGSAQGISPAKQRKAGMKPKKELTDDAIRTVQDAIAASKPHPLEYRGDNQAAFVAIRTLVRALLAIQPREYWEEESLEKALMEWHETVFGDLDGTWYEDFETAWEAFRDAWERIKVPLGQNLVELAWERSEEKRD